MKTIFLSRAKFGKFSAALAAAALLAGTAAPGVLAAPYTADFTKTIDMTAATGAGVPHGDISFTIGTVTGDLPKWASDTIKGTANQIMTANPTASFTGGINKSVKAQFTFDSDDFAAPGDYLFTLTENDTGITGLTEDPSDRYIVVRVLNTNPAAPDGKLYISEVNVVSADGAAKAGEITNTYATYGLTVIKQLDGNFANANDKFIFTIELTDPDQTPHISAVTLKSGGALDKLDDVTGKTISFEEGSTVTFDAEISGGQKFEITGLPANTGYTIKEKGDAAAKYTTKWDGIKKTSADDKTSDAQEMGTADQTITVTNTRTAPTPTGLLLDAAPYGAMLLAAGTGSVLLLRKRRDSDE